MACDSTSAAVLCLLTGEDGWTSSSSEIITLFGSKWIASTSLSVPLWFEGSERWGGTLRARRDGPDFVLDMELRGLLVFEESGFKNPTRLCCLSCPEDAFLRGIISAVIGVGLSGEQSHDPIAPK